MANLVVKDISIKERNDLLEILKARFDKNKKIQLPIEWSAVQLKLQANPDKLWSLLQMEKTGGEPDLVVYDQERNQFHFYDCAAETPKDRRSLCYDKEALDARKENKPKSSALEMAFAMGIDLLDEEQYRALQELGNFDQKTSNWIKTPESIRKLGGALFCDFRYDTVFVYHNGASSYYASRGFRGILKI